MLNIFDNVMQTWQTKLNDSTRASTYLVFSEFSFKKYLDIILIAKYKYAFTRLQNFRERERDRETESPRPFLTVSNLKYSIITLETELLFFVFHSTTFLF